MNTPVGTPHVWGGQFLGPDIKETVHVHLISLRTARLFHLLVTYLLSSLYVHHILLGVEKDL